MNANSPSIRASPRSQRSLRATRVTSLSRAGDEVDHLLAAVLDRRLEHDDKRGRGRGEADGEHDPVDEAITPFLATYPLRRLEETEEESVEHSDHPFRR